MPFSMGDDSPPPPWSPPSSSKPLARPVRALPSPPGNSGRDAPPPLSSSSLPSVDEEASWILSDEDGSELSRRATRLPDYGEARDGAGAGRRLVAVNLDEEESSTPTLRSTSYPYPPETPVEGSFSPDFPLLEPSSPTGSTSSSLPPLTPSNSTSSSHPRIRAHYSLPPSEPSTSSHSSQYPVEKSHFPSSSPPPPRAPFDSNRRSLSPLSTFHHPPTGTSSSYPHPERSHTSFSSSSSTTSSSSSDHSYPTEKALSSSSRSSNSSHTASPPPSSPPPPPPTPTIEAPEIIPTFNPLIAYNPRPTASGASSSLSRSMSAAERRRSMQAQAPSMLSRGAGSLAGQLGQLSLRSGETGGGMGRGGAGGYSSSTRSDEGEGRAAGGTRSRSSSTWSSSTG
ncbi:hypothetical protein BDY24DRAFT_413353 [Mrakia frigida]|uniref:uncharacterized protein n=1 Tax=Mrakia frigida TaxID=29902 RepID=UPI003FCC1122